MINKANPDRKGFGWEEKGDYREYERIMGIIYCVCQDWRFYFRRRLCDAADSAA